MGRLSAFFVVCAIAAALRMFGLSPSASMGSAQQLVVDEQPDRVELAWRGPVAPPMRDEFAAAFERFQSDRRPIVITLNSPGGSVEHGREVFKLIRNAAHMREIRTVVESGGVCASMCVPLYLSGARRLAAPDARFMFHGVRIDVAAAQKKNPSLPPLSANLRDRIETEATDRFYLEDLDQSRVNERWLAKLRGRVVGHDVWLSGKQLVDEASGVVDALKPAT